ncbi:MAG: class IIb bacteriocin, lactobin A/cerein 7B family [Clostridiales bacterium]|jgi:lactobin A/cerein 7B family class IIb bacteriocin|nr:class IIb bacteriocin, lactobin A/cerein 7B family [Clostridiales bacterium]
MLTQKKTEDLSAILTADPERAKKLLDLEPADAIAELSALGSDVTLDELKEYGEALKSASSGDVLDDAALDEVAGGIAPVLIGVLAGVSGVLGYKFGKELGKKFSW